MGQLIAKTGFEILDFMVLGFFFLSILLFNARIETETNERPSTHSLMIRFRRQWMEVLLTRDHRVVDANILAILQQSSRFFSSGMMLAIGGVIALMSRPDLLTNIQSIFGREYNAQISTIKLFFVALILTNGFLKFIWSGRLFGYCAIVMAAVPESDGKLAQLEAGRAAQLNITASRSFNRGLRMIYFAMAALCWLLGSIPFMIAIVFVNWTIWRREFASHSRDALLLERNE